MRSLSRALGREVTLQAPSRLGPGSGGPLRTLGTAGRRSTGRTWTVWTIGTRSPIRPAGGHVLRLRGRCTADHGDARPAARALPAGTVRDAAVPAEHRGGPADGAPGFVEDAWIGRTVRVGDEVQLAITSRARGA